MAPRLNSDLIEISKIMQTSMMPLVSKITTMDEKINALALDRVTRTDIEKLRTELIGSMVPRDAYEPRHAALVDRDAQLEASLRDMRRELQEDMKTTQAQNQADMQRLHDRLESGKAQYEKRIDDIDDKIEKAKEAELSTKDKLWMRLSIISGVVAVLLSIIEFAITHMHVN